MDEATETIVERSRLATTQCYGVFDMPMVDGKKYAYTPAGKAAAKKAKEKKAKKMDAYKRKGVVKKGKK